MPTQIIDGFKLNAATPIDSRLVTAGTSSRNSMVYKYEGLRVYDTIQKMPFVYIDGAWQEESVNTITNTGGSGTSMLLGGTLNYIPKITSTGTTNSNIREYTVGNERRIGINVPTGQITSTLQVGGTITATNFVGTIASTNINGIINLNQIQNANDNNKKFVLKSILNLNQWVEETTGENIIVKPNTTDPLLYLVLSKAPVTTTGNNLYVVNNTQSDLIAANPSTRQLLLGTANNITKAPQYSFKDNLTTGMYGNSAEIGLTLVGSKRIYVDSNTVGINVGGTTIAKFETGTMSITGVTKITGATIITGDTTIAGTSSLTGKTTISGNTTITGTTATITAQTTINGATTITGATKITGTLELTDTFKYTKSPSPGYILTCADANGNGAWTSGYSIGLPFGAIIMWSYNITIPDDFKICNGTGFICLNGAYKGIPDLRERNITGAWNSTDIGAYGEFEPDTKQQVTLSKSNIPNHRHYINSYFLNPTATSTFTETTNNSTGHSHTYHYADEFGGSPGLENGVGSNSSQSTSKALITGSVTTTISFHGNTYDGTDDGLSGAAFDIPHIKGYKLTFIIKINPSASQYTSGHYSDTIPAYTAGAGNSGGQTI